MKATTERFTIEDGKEFPRTTMDKPFMRHEPIFICGAGSRLEGDGVDPTSDARATRPGKELSPVAECSRRRRHGRLVGGWIERQDNLNSSLRVSKVRGVAYQSRLKPTEDRCSLED